MANKLHSTVEAGSRHGIHNLQYPTATAREAGTSEDSGISMSSDLVGQVALQADDWSLWILLDSLPITWGQILTANTLLGEFTVQPIQNAGLSLPVGVPYRLADEAYIELDAETSGVAMMLLNRTDVVNVVTESAVVSWSPSGAVVLLANTTNVANSDLDTNFCIFDNGSSGVRIKNRLGATRDLTMITLSFLSAVV